MSKKDVYTKQNYNFIDRREGIIEKTNNFCIIGIFPINLHVDMNLQKKVI